MHSLTKLTIVFISLLLTACTTTENTGDILEGDSKNQQQQQLTDSTEIVPYHEDTPDIGNEISTHQLGPEFQDPQNPLSTLTVYFAYDSSQVQQEYIAAIAAHAEYLRSYPSLRMVLAGHGDERGSAEYNIALGEQRAKAVAKMMKMQGVQATQLEVVSYGEEKPATTGHDEAAWQMNRRVELLYQGQ